DRVQHFQVVMDADARIQPGIVVGDLTRAIAAAIVDDDILPVTIALGKHALDALGQVGLAVINRRDDTHQGRGSVFHCGSCRSAGPAYWRGALKVPCKRLSQAGSPWRVQSLRWGCPS